MSLAPESILLKAGISSMRNRIRPTGSSSSVAPSQERRGKTAPSTADPGNKEMSHVVIPWQVSRSFLKASLSNKVFLKFKAFTM